MSAKLVALYEDTRHQAQQRGTFRLRWAARRARQVLATDPLEPAYQVRLIALEQELRARGRLRAPSLPRRPGQAVRRVPASMMDRFRRVL